MFKFIFLTFQYNLLFEVCYLCKCAQNETLQPSSHLITNVSREALSHLHMTKNFLSCTTKPCLRLMKYSLGRNTRFSSWHGFYGLFFFSELQIIKDILPEMKVYFTGILTSIDNKYLTNLGGFNFMDTLAHHKLIIENYFFLF